MAAMFALKAPCVLSLAGTTLPFAADACVALSVAATLSVALLRE
jgi:hypothetical protein